MKEIWKDIKDYEGIYQVSNLGNIRSLPRNGTINKPRILKQSLSKNGYNYVYLHGKPKCKNYRVHRLVALAFITNFNNLPHINHKDENKQNNTVDNLEWCNAKYNNNYGARISKSILKYQKPILQFDLNKNFIKKWDSIKEASHSLNILNSSISSCCSGRIKQTHGFIFEYANK